MRVIKAIVGGILGIFLIPIICAMICYEDNVWFLQRLKDTSKENN